MNSKRKNRGPVRPPRNRSIIAEGVYSNPHFMYAATAQIGNIVRLQTPKGNVFEGVFKTFSSNFDVVLEVATQVSGTGNNDAPIQPGTVIDKLIFHAKDILHIQASNVDMDYPSRDTFLTDVDISARINGANREEKELEPWDGELNGSDTTSLELDSTANGWDANDMFKKNEQEYGVTTTYDSSLSTYTWQLQRTDTEDYKAAEAKANQIANEIENTPNHKARLELENGDEETLYAAVVRPNESNGKYIPPAKRKNQNTGKTARSTPPPVQIQSASTSSVTSPSSSNTSCCSSSSASMPQTATPSPKGAPPPVNYQQNPNAAKNVTQHAPQQIVHMAPQNQVNAAAVAQVQVQNQAPAPIVVHNQGPQQPQPHHQRHSHTPPHGYGGQQRQGGNQKGQHMNGEAKQMSRGSRNVYQPTQPPNIPPQPHQQIPQGLPYQGNEMPPKMPDMSNHNRHHREDVKDLQQFSQDFQLAPPQPQMVPKEIPQPHVPPQGQHHPQIMEQQVVPQHIAAQQQQQPPMSKPQPQASPPQPSISPPQDGVEKVTNAMKKSTLNPNAKEFVLNPAAKPFQPRSPSTPSLSRPHTPQTPSHSPYIPTPMNGPPMGQSQTPILMPMSYMMTSQPQYAQQPQGNRIRKIPMGQMRTDGASQLQVAAATGQPLLAPAPIQPFVYQHGLNHINPQSYHPMHVRMYDPPPQMQYLPPNPSQASSPAQPPPYSQGQPLQAPPQQQYHQAAPPPQGGVHTHQYLSMCNLIPAQPHMMQGMPYLPQGPPPQHPIPLILHNQQHNVHQGPA